jgi:HK97 family phage major capsid protein/HK97 family phage prohead protease
MHRAYSVLHVKAVDGAQRVITGTATTPEPDRLGDVIEPLGVKFKNPLPLLLFHDTKRPVGTVKFDKATKDGITFSAHIPEIDEPGTLKDRVDEAWQSVVAGLIRGVSIGFSASMEFAEMLKTGGIRFLKTEVFELSLVTIPANQEAVISTIKSIDAPHLAASGAGEAANKQPSPGVSGHVVRVAQRGAQAMAKTIQEQITAFEATRQAKSARMVEIMTKSGETGATLDTAESEEYDGLDVDVKKIDEHLVRLNALEKANKAAAVVVDGRTPVAAAASRGGDVITLKRELPKGLGFTRYVMALAAAKGSRMEAAEFAKRWESSTPEVALVLKAAMDAGTTTDSTWAAPLVVYQNLASEFIELLRASTIIGRINGFRRVPFNVSMPRQTSGSTVGWVGQGKPKPVGELAFDSVSLGMAKAAGIVVIAEELARSSDPSAEAIISQDLRNAITLFLDTQFIDPAVAAVANVSPAAVTNGATVIDSTGVTAAYLRADFASALAVWTAAGLSIAGGVVVMTETQAIRLSMIVNAFGQPEFPGLTATGGTLFGLPVVTSENVPAEGGSPAGNRIVLLKPGEILMADNGGIMIDVSREASVQMNSTPDDPATASTVYTSFWQNNLVGIRAERLINWLKRRTAAAVIIEGALYTG